LNMIQLSRYVIGLSWIYHGILPKLVHVAELEMAIAGTLGFPEDITYILIKITGVSEILFGIAFIVFYRLKAVQWLNLLGLVGLLGFAAVMAPFVLLEAFNPVTTNIPLIVLSIFLMKSNLESSGRP